MSEDINALQNRIDFLVNGGALKLLTDFLTEKNIKALITEPGDAGRLNVLDAAGIVPDGLSVKDEASPLFTKGIAHEAFELEFSDASKTWPGVVRIRGGQWQVFILMKEKAADPKALLAQLKPYAGLVSLWQVNKNISATEKKLSRLSYMILATKSTHLFMSAFYIVNN